MPKARTLVRGLSKRMRRAMLRAQRSIPIPAQAHADFDVAPVEPAIHDESSDGAKLAAAEAKRERRRVKALRNTGQSQ